MSRKNWPDGPPSGRVASQTVVATPSSMLRVASGLRVLTQPGSTELTKTSVPQVDANGQITANRQSDNRPLRSKGQPDFYGNNILGGKLCNVGVDIGTRARSRQSGEPDPSRRARTRWAGCPAGTARGTGPRLCRPARPRLAGEAHLRHDRNLPVRARSDEVAPRGADRIAGRRRSRANPAEFGGSAGVGNCASARRARERDCGPRGKTGGVLFCRANFGCSCVAQAAARRPGGSAAAQARRRRTGTPDRRRQPGRAARANFFPRFTLIALGGTQDTGFRLFNPGNAFGTIGPSVDFPLFDVGLRQAELNVAKAHSPRPRRDTARSCCAPSRRSRTICPHRAGLRRSCGRFLDGGRRGPAGRGSFR